MNEALRKVCRFNLLKALERLKEHADPSVVTQATMAEGLFLDFESYEKSAIQSGAPEGAPDYSDGTNYERYKLLRSFGLSPQQLIDVAKSDGLHDLRVIRMLRLTLELDLEEATQLVNLKKTGI
jgi:hypothetical protein